MSSPRSGWHRFAEAKSEGQTYDKPRESEGGTMTPKKEGADCKPGSVIKNDVWSFLSGSSLRRISCGLPGLKDGRSSSRHCVIPSLALHRMGFAKPSSRLDAGGHLPRHFTLTPRLRGGVFSVALSLGLLPVPARNHPALRCPDFPQVVSRDHSSAPLSFSLALYNLSAT